MLSRPLVLRGKIFNPGKEPLICTPLVGVNEGEIASELAAILPKQPDLLEWRVDFFSGIADVARVVNVVQLLKAKAGVIPVIFTRRSFREGGCPNELNEDQVFDLYAAVCRTGYVDLFDYELGVGSYYFQQAVALARETGVKLIASYHNFQHTPDADELVARFIAMEQAGADVAKIAVMPNEQRDVLTLLDATLTAYDKIALPIISMSMGSSGVLSRLFGWMFGSSISFAIGEKGSAPGQLSIEQLKMVTAILQSALHSK